MRIVAVTALAIVALSGCQVEEGEEAAEVKIDPEKNAVPYEDCVDYDFQRYVFTMNKDGQSYRVPVNFRIPATICQRRTGMAVQMCPENGGKKDMEVLMASDDFGTLPNRHDSWTHSFPYVSKKDNRIYNFFCEHLELKGITMIETFEEIGVKIFQTKKDVHPGDIQNQCWPQSPSECRSPTP